MKIETPLLYYAECRMNGQTGLLVGPFLTFDEAAKSMEQIGPIAVNADPMLENATFGVMSVTRSAGYGTYNELAKMMGFNPMMEGQ